MHRDQLLGNRYRLEKPVGSGGMGEVWQATDQALNRTVAAKILHPALGADAQFRERFLREARTLAKLSSPGIVNIFDAREETTEDGSHVFYLVMDYVTGRPLSELLREQGRMDAAWVMSMVAKVAAGLNAAHHAGVVHRDVKPQNILVDDDGTATIVDFGIARTHGQTGLTMTGTVMGTVTYASPEQLQDEDLTGASDVYSLGVVAYECLTGNPPFQGGTTAATITGHLTQPPPPLPVDVPVPVAEVVMRALAKTPAERYPSASAFAHDCRQAASGRMPLPPATEAIPAPPSPPRPAPQPAPQPAAARAPMPTNPMPVAEPDYRPVPTPAKPKPNKPRRRRGRAVLVTLLILLLIAGAAAAYVYWPKGRGNAASPNNTDSTSQSSSPPAKAPDGVTKEPTQVISVATGKCLDIGSLGVTTPDCSEDNHKTFTFTRVANASPNNNVYFFEDEGDKCVNVDPKGPKLSDGECTKDSRWRLTWIRTADGWDVWKIQHPAGTDHLCLMADNTKLGVGLAECDNTKKSRWRTVSASS
ncbi:MAG TPA: protein kinase [Stackebrandtia sp.]|uniref:serine/threonine-protein kinase n=1 Tax=Stackebrandtia sp. TaxID=2023065 RepID=UPI002D7273E8|nr:protein kinase [Stackebrandtia sp.]HZE41726.1 protein kinase [Stackebrandtia sp.]